MFTTNLVSGKIEKENHLRKVRKSEERKVKDMAFLKIFKFDNLTLKEQINNYLFM